VCTPFNPGSCFVSIMSTPLNNVTTYTLLAAIASGGCAERYGFEAQTADPAVHMSPTAVSTSSAIVNIVDPVLNTVNITVNGYELVWFYQDSLDLDSPIVLGWGDNVLPPFELFYNQFTLSALVANEPVYLTPFGKPANTSFLTLAYKLPFTPGEVLFTTYASLDAAGYSTLSAVTLSWIFYTTFPPVLEPITPAYCLPDCDAVVCAQNPCFKC
jgi:hypothetical protein